MAQTPTARTESPQPEEAKSTSPAQIVRSLAASPSSNAEAETPAAAAVADPDFTLTPVPTKFQGFSPTPLPTTVVGKTPITSVPTENAETVGDLSPPVEGYVYTGSATPAAAAVAHTPVTTPNTFPGFGPSPAPARGALAPSDLGLTPPQAGEVYSNAQPCTASKATTPPADAAGKAGLHTPTWNSPVAGRQTGTPLQEVKQPQALKERTSMNTFVVNSLFGTAGRNSPLSMPIKKMDEKVQGAKPSAGAENTLPVEV